MTSFSALESVQARADGNARQRGKFSFKRLKSEAGQGSN
jgi:hypothetical protein